MSSTTDTDALEVQPTEEASPGFVGLAILLTVTALIFAWSVWAAVGNLIQVPALFDQYRSFVTQNGASELAKSTPWPALIATLLLPVLGWGAAWWLGRGRGLRARIVFFVVAYAGVCALTVSLTSYVFRASSVL
ncbi:hypothetical protein VH571_08715 [Frondihabitans sp. 4ASC-45]|uniref:hypothetical protein n=1 Tax=Frondihabitans sp. 4ASC-45 TaxID=3111636 RepID=UPI003C139D3A